MAKILHLENNPRTKRAIADILRESGHEVDSTASIDKVADCNEYDLYICGTLNKHSDGLAVAAELKSRGHRVIILAYRQKFSLIPFISTHSLEDRELVKKYVNDLLAKD